MKKEPIEHDSEEPDTKACDGKNHNQVVLQLPTNEPTPTTGMVQEHLLTKAGTSLRNEQAERVNVCYVRAFVPPKVGSTQPRHVSLLERQLFPVFSNSKQSSKDGVPSAAQLTIFYNGTINVYDNVPADKVKAIMLLAGESSLSEPKAMDLQQMEVKNPVHHANSTSTTMIRGELQLARRMSLLHFLERRRCRISSKSPYCSPSKK